MMFCSNTRLWNACSPDGIAILSYPNESEDPFPWVTYNAVSVEGRWYPIACVELKAAVARTSPDPKIRNISDDMDVLFPGKTDVLNCIGKKHVVHIA